MKIPLDNQEMFVGVILVITSIVGLVGGSVVIGPFSLNLGTAKGLAYAFILLVGLLGIFIILKELLIN